MNKILIVEDHEALGYVLMEYLKLKGFQPTLETSAEAALNTIRKHVPNLCLLDVSLPGMDGFDLSKQIRLLYSDMPIIFLTARALKVDRIKGLMLQADDYLVKPLDPGELPARVRRSRLRPTPTRGNGNGRNGQHEEAGKPGPREPPIPPPPADGAPQSPAPPRTLARAGGPPAKARSRPQARPSRNGMQRSTSRSSRRCTTCFSSLKPGMP